MVKKRAGTGRRTGILGGSVVIVGAFAFLLYGGIEENLVYFLTPTELLERGARAYDAPLRLGGEVKPGSVEWNPEALDPRFRLTDAQTEIEVHSRGAPPQMFRPGMSVVVEGEFRRAGVFESHNLMVMHSNEYYPEGDDSAIGGQHPAAGAKRGFPEGHPMPPD